MSFWWDGEEDSPQRKKRKKEKIRGGDDGIRSMRGKLS
jgi:hypothetical protein